MFAPRSTWLNRKLPEGLAVMKLRKSIALLCKVYHKNSTPGSVLSRMVAWLILPDSHAAPCSAAASLQKVAWIVKASDGAVHRMDVFAYSSARAYTQGVSNESSRARIHASSYGASLITSAAFCSASGRLW
jgi:hypothetical protein